MAVAALAVGFSACKKYSEQEKGDTSTSGVTALACDETFANVMEEEVGVFEYIYPDITVLPYYANETECFDSLLNLKMKTIVVTRELTAQETQHLKNQKKNPKSKKIAVDAIALIVNNDNPIDELSVEDLSEILTGKVTNWNDVPGNYKGDISVVFDNPGSSTVNYMKERVTKGEKFGDNVFAQGSCPKVIEAVKEHKGAIGIIGVSWLSSNLDGSSVPSIEQRAEYAKSQTDSIAIGYYENQQFNPDVKVLAIYESDKGIPVAYKPYQYNIYNGTYPFHRPIYMITVGVGGMPSNGFYSFVTGMQGQKLILTTGVLPAFIPLNNVELQ